MPFLFVKAWCSWWQAWLFVMFLLNGFSKLTIIRYLKLICSVSLILFMMLLTMRWVIYTVTPKASTAKEVGFFTFDSSFLNYQEHELLQISQVPSIRGVHDPTPPDNPSQLEGYWVGFNFGILTRCIFRPGSGHASGQLDPTQSHMILQKLYFFNNISHKL